MRPCLALSFILLLALAACGSADESASYKLPTSSGGRLCSHQCVEAQDYCLQDCNIHQRQCVDAVQAQAIKDYDAYTRDQFDNHLPIEKLPSSFEHQTPCSETHQDCATECAHGYQDCFQACGGEVDIRSSCKYFCF